MFALTKPSTEQIQSFARSQKDLPFSYPEVGATRGSLPKGYNIDRNQIKLGNGEEVFNRAVDALRRWEMFGIGWVELCWPNAPIETGSTVVVVARHFYFWSAHPARIVYTFDDADAESRRIGFAYGTLPGHGELGEERFMIEWRRKDDSVWYDILAFSRPKALLAKLGYPVSRFLQRRFGRASKQAMFEAANRPQTDSR